jgi:hypothetical protein
MVLIRQRKTLGALHQAMNKQTKKKLTNATYKRRLLRLANEVAKVAPSRFDFGNFSSPDCKELYAYEVVCGTNGCALGLATTMPYFRKLGLMMTLEGGWNGSKHPIVRLEDGRKTYGRKTYGAGTGLCYAAQACKQIFGISKNETEFLFFPTYKGTYRADQQVKKFGWYGPDADASVMEVANHIKRFAECGRFGTKKTGE